MKMIKFPPRYRHEHPPVRNVNDIFADQLTPGQLVADKVASIIGSWKFIVIQSVLLTFWIILNIIAYVRHRDPYPFILLNLFLSLQAAYAAPVLMMSQNRQAEKDRLEAHNDYTLNIKSEEEVHIILDNLHVQNEVLQKILEAVNNRNEIV
jgi:uncharacterized membrane protein